MDEGNRGVPARDPPATPTEVRSVECFVLVSSLSLDIMTPIDRTILSPSTCLSAHN